MKNWYAVHLRPMTEKAVSKRIRQQGILTFFPFERVRKRQKLPNRDQYKIKIKDYPLLPGYIFVLCNETDLFAINETPGVLNVVRPPNQDPLPIPDAVMSALFCRTDHADLVREEDRTTRRHDFDGQIGDIIRFKEETPYNGLVAAIKSLDRLDSRNKIIVSLQMLGAERDIPVPSEVIGEIVR